MPNFQKSKGFQLRSGNKGGAPFKMMGSSSPVYKLGEKEGNTKESNAQKKIDYESNKYDEAKIKSDKVIKDRADLKKKNEAAAKEKKGREAYAKTEAGEKEAAKKLAADKAATDKETKASRGWKEKKEANKAEKKENRGTRKDFKKGNKEEIAELKESGADRKTVRAAKKENRQEQKDLKQSHRDDSKANKKDYKSGDDYKAHKAEQKQKLKNSIGALSDRLDPDNRGLYAKSKAAEEGRVDKNIQNEKDAVNTTRTQQLVDATNKSNNKSEELPSSQSDAVNNDGTANVTTGGGKNLSNKKSSVRSSKELANE